MTSTPPPAFASLDDIVNLVVAEVQPVRIVLFGSAVRGDAGSESDLDVMVVMPDDADRRGIARSLYLAMGRKRFGAPVEFHITTDEILERHRDDVGYYHFDAIRQGRELYAA